MAVILWGCGKFKQLSRIWKGAPGGVTWARRQWRRWPGVRDGATVDSMIEAMLVPCGPLATQLIQRAIDIAQRATDFDDLATTLYDNVLMAHPSSPQDTSLEPPRAADERCQPFIQPLPDAEGFYLQPSIGPSRCRWPWRGLSGARAIRLSVFPRPA